MKESRISAALDWMAHMAKIGALSETFVIQVSPKEFREWSYEALSTNKYSIEQNCHTAEVRLYGMCGLSILVRPRP